MVRISCLSSKELRNNNNTDEAMMCQFKSDVALTPGELLVWTRECRKLTRVKHRSNLIRLVHG